MNDPILSVSDLTMHYLTPQGEVKGVDRVTFDLGRGKILGIVGESGSGKTSVAISLLKLLPDNARISAGRVIFDGRDLLAMREDELRRYRGGRISLVLQAAMNSLDPVYRLEDQIVEAFEAHGLDGSRIENREMVAHLFQVVGLDPILMTRYPHELSGGMRHRAVVAMALACNPEIIVADEPTSGLDVVLQDRLIRELIGIRKRRGMSMIFISHDIGVIAEVSDFVGVMYAGRLVEHGESGEVFRNPIHPYSSALISAFPSIYGEKRPLAAIPGDPPNPIDRPHGCPFHPRCPDAIEICGQLEPPVVERGDHWALCWNPRQ